MLMMAHPRRSPWILVDELRRQMPHLCRAAEAGDLRQRFYAAVRHLDQEMDVPLDVAVRCAGVTCPGVLMEV